MPPGTNTERAAPTTASADAAAFYTSSSADPPHANVPSQLREQRGHALAHASRLRRCGR
jgi:hypothetical protein